MPPAAVAAQNLFTSTLRPNVPKLPGDKRKPWAPLGKGVKHQLNNNNNEVAANFKPLPIKPTGGRKTIKSRNRKSRTRRNKRN
jgi:hypothetical protein